MHRPTDGHTQTLRNTHRWYPQNHKHTEIHTVDSIYRQKAGVQTNTPSNIGTRNTDTHHTDTHVHPDAQEHTQENARVHTQHTNSRTLAAQRLPLLQDSAPGRRGKGRSKDGQPPGTLQTSFPGDTHRADRDDRACHRGAGPAHAEPTAKQCSDHGAASAALQAPAGTRRPRARPPGARLRSPQA